MDRRNCLERPRLTPVQPEPIVEQPVVNQALLFVPPAYRLVGPWNNGLLW